MKTSHIIIGGGIAIAAIALFAIKKVQTLKAVFDKMTIAPSAIKKFKLSLTEVSFDMDFTITNPTTDAFSVSGASIVSLKRVMAFRNGKYLGQAEVNMDAIDIPANSTVRLTDLPFKISLQTALETLSEISDINVTTLTAGLSLQAVVGFLGKEYTIEN